MRNTLIELIDKAFLESDDNYGRPNTDQVADYLLANGVVVIDASVVSAKNRPLISQCLGKPIDEIIELVLAQTLKGGERVVADRCVVCDEIIPEGRQVCPNCERKRE